MERFPWPSESPWVISRAHFQLHQEDYKAPDQQIQLAACFNSSRGSGNGTPADAEAQLYTLGFSSCTYPLTGLCTHLCLPLCMQTYSYPFPWLKSATTPMCEKENKMKRDLQPPPNNLTPIHEQAYIMFAPVLGQILK